MKRWEKAVDSFLRDWIVRDEFAGALVCGSYVTGDPTKRSDIDLHIILFDTVEWRERGNKYVDGFLIEYFANPPGQVRNYFADDFASRSTASMVQFITGKIIRDQWGIVSELREEAMSWKSKLYPVLVEPVIELKKYHLWDTLDNLLDCYEMRRSDFDFVYYQSILLLFQAYSSLLGLEQIPFDQVSRYLSDPVYLRKYLKKPFPDRDFATMFLHAIECNDSDERIRVYEALFAHVMNKRGGFEVDGWTLRTPAQA